MIKDPLDFRRAASAALAGLLVQLALAILMLLVGLWAQSPALHAATWHLFGGLPIWIVLLLIYQQHRLERLERLESERLSQSDASAAALFDEHGKDLQIARRRLDNLYKYGLGTVSLLTAIYLLVVGGLLTWINYGRLKAGTLDATRIEAGTGAILLTFLCAGVAFIAFVLARYAAGMTKIREWQMLRGGASYLMGNALVAVLGVIGAVFVLALGNEKVLGVLAVIVPAVMVLIGAEVLFTFLMGAYRPRRPGEIPRPAFDSRVLGLLTSPESLAKAISDTINYQFGFEVSSSWFYGLLSRSITPLVIVGLVMLLAVSCLVIVGPHEQAVVTTFGAMSGEPRGPGLHIKAPWPIGRVTLYEVGRVHQVTVGSAIQGLRPGAAILWTNAHVQGGKEEFFVTAPTPLVREAESGGGMELVGAEVAVQYRIKDNGLPQYVSSVTDPDQLLHHLAERRVSAYFTTKDIDTLIGSGRTAAAVELREQIQADADAAGLGLDVVFVSFTGVHPPQDGEVANAFLEQIGALQEMESTIQKSEQEAIKALAGVAGSTEHARAINAAISELERLKSRSAAPAEGGDTAGLDAKIAEQELRIEKLLSEAGGEAAVRIFRARAVRWQRPLAARAEALRFPAEYAAYQQAPEFYKHRVYLAALSAGLADARKIIIASDAATPPVVRMDLKDQLNQLEDILKNP